MFETMSVYSLVLMLVAAFIFPPAFRQLLRAPHALELHPSRNLWIVTLPFAALMWYLAALWAQAMRPPGASLALILVLLASFLLAYAALPFHPRPGLARLSRIIAVLLSYGLVSWIITSSFAAATGATFHIQALLFGYLVLCPALAAALLPRPRPLATGLFIVLTALLLYATGTWATSAFWGLLPALPAWTQPGISILVLLAVLAVLTWVTWQVRDTPFARLVTAYLVAIGKLLFGLGALLGQAILAIPLDYARTVFAAVRWIFVIFIPRIGELIGLGSVTVIRTLWQGIRLAPVVFWKLVVGLGSGLVAVAVWLMAVLIPGTGRGIIGIVGRLWNGLLGGLRSLVRASVWVFVTALPGIIYELGALALVIARAYGAIATDLWHAFVLLARGTARAAVWIVKTVIPALGRGTVALVRALLHLVAAMPRTLWRIAVWLVTDFVPGLGQALLAILLALAQGLLMASRGIHRFLDVLIRATARRTYAIVNGLLTVIGMLILGFIRAITWLLTVFLPAAASGLVELLQWLGYASAHTVSDIRYGLVVAAHGLWHSLVLLAGTIRHGLAAIARGLWHACLTLSTVLIPGAARAFGYGLAALARGSWSAIRWTIYVFIPAAALGFLLMLAQVAQAIVSFATWLATVALPSVGRGLDGITRAIVRAIMAAARGIVHSLRWIVAVTPRYFAHLLLAVAGACVVLLVAAVRALVRVFVWTATVLLPGIPKAFLLLILWVARAAGAACRAFVGALVTMIVDTILGIGHAVRDMADVGLRILTRALVPVFLISAATMTIVLAVTVVWPYMAGLLWPPPPPSLHIVAGSNLKSIEPILQRWGAENQVAVSVTYKGSLDIEASLKDSSIPYDAVWQGDSLWTDAAAAQGLLKHDESIMCSPVVLGVKKSVAAQLGWVENKDVRLREILAAVETARLHMFMASPTKSNSGALAYLGLLRSFSGNPDALIEADLERQDTRYSATTLMRRMDRTGDSSGWLRDSCRDQYGRCDAMINYESLILEMNRETVARGQEPMYIVYPTEGLGMADFPLALVNRRNAEKESLFLRLQDYLQSDTVQDEIAALGNRVGAGCNRVNDTVFRQEWGADLARQTESVRHPARPVIDQAKNLYQTTFRKPSFTVYLLDFSTSMEGSRRSYLQMAMTVVLDQKEATKYLLQGTSDDATVVIPFAGRTLNDQDLRAWTVSGSDSTELAGLLRKIQNQPTADMTDIYTPVANAFRLMKEEDIANYIPAIILLTDGESNRGSIEEVKQALEKTGLYNVPIFGITFGDASPQQLNELAGLTGGRVFDGTKNLIEAFRQAKGQN